MSEISGAFETYWKSDLARSLSSLGASGDPALVDRARFGLQTFAAEVADSAYGLTLQESSLTAQLSAGGLSWFWAQARLLYDLPEKVRTDPEDRSAHMGPGLDALLASAQREVIAVSPYFIPGQQGMALLRALRERGVSVTVVTNSLAATDVPAAHSGYVRYRRELLASGIDLYEIRPSPTLSAQRRPRLGSSQASLHAKTVVIDGEKVVVGSMNMDPRSDQLNTELGVVIDSRNLARTVQEWRHTGLPKQAWRVRIAADGAAHPRSSKLQWIVGEPGREVIHTGSEPEASWWRRFVSGFGALLPIEKQL